MKIKNIKVKKYFIITSLSCMFLVVLCVVTSKYLLHPITPNQLTNTVISETLFRIHMYARKYHELPTMLEQLAVREGFINRTTDAWGRELLMKISTDNKITLLSFGKDGMPGGVGDDSDISQSYWIRRPDGEFWIDDKNWIYDARIWSVRK